MAIYQAANPAAASEPAVDIEAWTEQTIVAMSSVSISTGQPIAPVSAVATALPATAVPAPVVERGTSVSLAIPLDAHLSDQRKHTSTVADASAAQAINSGYVKRQELSRRDSLKRREALLKGKEGTRRRQRWENDRLLNNPHAQPPLPSDWEVRPTYTVKHVPYALAGLWDAELAARKAHKKSASRRKPVSGGARNGTGPTEVADPEDETARLALRELRETLKKARGAKGLLQDLEVQVRRFVENWETFRVQKEQEEAERRELGIDSEDDEIVFVGRNGQMRDVPSSPSASMDSELFYREALVFESLEGEVGASFGRWLVHSIGAYYGLRTWSVTVGSPARREAYVGVKEKKPKSGYQVQNHVSLPRPLWGMV